MTAPPELSDQHKKFLLDLFTTALEGGIGYWSEASKYHWSNDDGTEDINGFYAIIHPIEDGWGVFADKECGDTEEDQKPLRIDLEVMSRGSAWMNLYVQGIVDNKGKQVSLDEIKPFREKHYHWQYVKAYNSNGESGDYDAGTADMIVQFGLFGEVVYG